MKKGSHYLQIMVLDVDAQNVWMKSCHLDVNPVFDLSSLDETVSKCSREIYLFKSSDSGTEVYKDMS